MLRSKQYYHISISFQEQNCSKNQWDNL